MHSFKTNYNSALSYSHVMKGIQVANIDKTFSKKIEQTISSNIIMKV